MWDPLVIRNLSMESLPSNRIPRPSRLSRAKTPFPFLSNACHTGHIPTTSQLPKYKNVSAKGGERATLLSEIAVSQWDLHSYLKTILEKKNKQLQQRITEQ